MKHFRKVAGVVGVFALLMPVAYADDPPVAEMHAIMTKKGDVKLVTETPTGSTILNNGNAITGGESLLLPNGDKLILPRRCIAGTTIKVHHHKFFRF
jgi:hypothetical protein